MIDPKPAPPYGCRPSPRRWLANARRGIGVSLLAALWGCGGRAEPGVVAPVQDPRGAAESLEEATAVRQPTLILFRWRMAEEGLRLSGRGVARVEPPYRARLDLFLENGEAVAVAVLVEDDLRLPVTLPGGLLPPAHLLWGSLGVFRVWPGTEVVGGEELAGGIRQIRMRLAAGDEVRYRFADEAMRSVELLERGSVVKRVELKQDGVSVPAEAVYRDLAAFRELVITRESVEHVASFPPDIWRP